MSLPSPPEALRKVLTRLRPRPAVRVPLEEALGLYLAAAIEAPARERSSRSRATVNGFALPAGVGPGEHRYRISERWTAPADEKKPADEEKAGPRRAPKGPDPILERVESGDLLEARIDRVVPIERATLLAGPGIEAPRVSIPGGALPAPGEGLLREEEDGLAAPAGARIDERLQAALLARGVATVECRRGERVGILAIGDELTDLLHHPAPANSRGAAERGGGEGELNGYWLAAAVRRLGHEAVPLGIVAESLEEGRQALLRASERKLRVLIVTGGLGRGISDRTAELIERTGGKIILHGASSRHGSKILLGEWLDLRILGLAGQPLEAAAAFDLFAAPGLLSLLGAGEEVVDWSRCAYPLPPLQPLPPPFRLPASGRSEPGGPWDILPVRSGTAGEPLPGSPFVPALSLVPWPKSPRIPWIENLKGWALIPPEPERFYHFQGSA